MDPTPGQLLRDARQRAGLTIAELAERAGTSRTTLSAYENGRKSPTVATFGRLLGALDRSLDITASALRFTEVTMARGQAIWVPDDLPRLTPAMALRCVILPRRIFWSSERTEFDLADPDDRAEVYAAVLSEGDPEDITSYIDGVLLASMWDTMWLPPQVRSAWQILIDQTRTFAA